MFHRLVACLLFAAKRARPDIPLCVAFLCMRVQNPTEEDLKKKGRLLGYVRRTIHLPLILGSDGSRKVTWNVDALFAAHPDMRSHTWAICTFGQGSVL